MQPEAVGGFMDKRRALDAEIEAYEPIMENTEVAPADRFAAVVQRFENIPGYKYGEDRRDNCGHGYLTERLSVGDSEVVLGVEVLFDTTGGQKVPKRLAVSWTDPENHEGFSLKEAISANQLTDADDDTLRTLSLLEESAEGAETALSVRS